MLSTTMSLSSMLSIVDDEASMKQYTEELAFVDREDGLALEAAIIRPPAGQSKQVAVIWIHGNTSRFYDMPYIQIGREIAALGYTFITSNTHGHDVTSVIWGPQGEANPGGACWERFEEIPLDLAAWIDLAMEEGFKGVVLVGHSFGANKVVYYQAERQDSRVLGIVSASGDIRWKSTPERLAEAEAMEAAGQADEVLPQLEVPWYRMSAKTYLGRARIAQHALTSDTETPYIAKVRCPILAFYGSEEEWCGTSSDLDKLCEAATGNTAVTTHIIEGADHVYWNKAGAAAGLIGNWIETLAA